MITEISCCRICGNADLLPILDLGLQVLTGVFPKARPEFVESGPLELVRCSAATPGACGLVQLKHSFEASQMYGDTYGYRSGLNRSMVEHLQGKAARIRNSVNLNAGDLVLDIGSNDGTTLRAMQTPGVALVGMDPSGVKFRQYYPEGAQLVGEFFSSAAFRREFGTRRAKVVTSIAMFYDLEAPLDFVRGVHEVLDDDGIWVFEQSYLPTMLAMNSYDTICHEHLEYYALKQIVWMAEKVGFRILDVELNGINGGSFSVTAAKNGSSYSANAGVVDRMLAEEKALGLDSAQIYAEFAQRVEAHRIELPARLRALKEEGKKVFGYGASTKGNVTLQYCGITEDLLPCIAEVNPDKFGSFAPGTLIPIVSEADARAEKPDVFMVLPWHFRDNIIAREQAFLQTGGELMFPLPQIEVFGIAENGTHRRA